MQPPHTCRHLPRYKGRFNNLHYYQRTARRSLLRGHDLLSWDLLQHQHPSVRMQPR